MTVPLGTEITPIRAVLSAQVGKFVGGTRLGDVEPLGEAYPEAAEFGQDLRGLDPLSNGLDAHGVADLADRRNHAAIDRVTGDIFDELAVNFEVIDRQRL